MTALNGMKTRRRYGGFTRLCGRFVESLLQGMKDLVGKILGLNSAAPQRILA